MPGHVLAEHANAARRRQKQAKKHAHRRGLACAVTAQERGDTAATDGERNVIHRPRRAVVLGEPDRGDGRRRGVRIWQHGGRASWLRAPAPASRGARRGSSSCWRNFRMPPCAHAYSVNAISEIRIAAAGLGCWRETNETPGLPVSGADDCSVPGAVTAADVGLAPDAALSVARW